MLRDDLQHEEKRRKLHPCGIQKDFWFLIKFFRQYSFISNLNTAIDMARGSSSILWKDDIISCTVDCKSRRWKGRECGQGADKNGHYWTGAGEVGEGCGDIECNISLIFYAFFQCWVLFCYEKAPTGCLKIISSWRRSKCFISSDVSGTTLTSVDSQRLESRGQMFDIGNSPSV